jgi:hypothetical protein
MQRKNWRLINAGFALVTLATAFFFYMLSIGSKSTDPKASMERSDKLQVSSAASAW